jgi:hypothetical protein
MTGQLLSSLVSDEILGGRLLEQFNVWQPAMVLQWYQLSAKSATIGYANTKAANPSVLERYGLLAQLQVINEQGVSLARKVFTTVYGVVGSAQELLDPLEGLDYAQWHQLMKQQLAILQPLVDGWVISVPTMEELVWWFRLLQPTKLPIEYVLDSDYQDDPIISELIVNQLRQSDSHCLCSADKWIEIAQLKQCRMVSLRFDYYDRLDLMERLSIIDEGVQVIKLQVNCLMDLSSLWYHNQWRPYYPLIISGEPSVVQQFVDHYIGIIGVVNPDPSLIGSNFISLLKQDLE